jgi:ribose/xylose/arabinose/galactoside ABC-type transport system permease subunit
MGSLNNGMSLMNVPTFYQETARGVVLLLAVAADQYRRVRKAAPPARPAPAAATPRDAK